MAAPSHKLMIIGVGNPWRGDDGAGLWIARRLREKLPPHIVIEECSGDQTRLLDLWCGAKRVLLVDVVCSGAAPGTLHRLGGEDGRILRGANLSSHSAGIAEILELGCALTLLPDELLIYAIEGRDFTAGAPISPDVMAGAERAVELILAELNGAGDVRHA